MNCLRICLSVCVLAVLCSAAHGGDWPTYQHDNARSGVTLERLELPLAQVWVHEARQAPRPAWPAPAERDIWHQLRDLKPVVTYDRAFHPVIHGERVYFGSSADDAVYALDGVTGEIVWTFRTDAPVRLAPAAADGRVYAGSDDGCVYCLDAATGGLVWERRIAPEDHRILGNGRMMSLFPVRTGVLVDGGVAYCFGGLFPAQGVYACALDAATGTPLVRRQLDLSPQGYLLASDTRLFVPTGRTDPAVLDRGTLDVTGSVSGGGGTYALLTGDTLISGPGRQRDELAVAEADTSAGIATYAGLHMIVHGGTAYLHSKESITALDRARHLELAAEQSQLAKKLDLIRKRLRDAMGDGNTEEKRALKQQAEEAETRLEAIPAELEACTLWEKPCRCPYTLILAGDTLYAGGGDEVEAYSAETGELVWSEDVPGRVYGLAVAQGALFASTDQGAIHCFRHADVDREHVAAPFVEPAPYADDAEVAAAARGIIEHTGITQGYCLDIGCGDGRLAYELAKRTELKVIGVDDAASIALAREVLGQTDMYGTRVAVHEASLDALPFTSRFANLVVSQRALTEGKLPPSAAEVARVLRPYGGTACIGLAEAPGAFPVDALNEWAASAELPRGELVAGERTWAVNVRGGVPGSGEWTQLYCDPSHTACSMDPLKGPITIQWFGEPGPRNIIDRHHRPMSPLFKAGRVFLPANDLIIAVDAYNGAPLWRLEVPNSRRVGALKNSGHMLLTDQHIYVVTQNECWAVDAATGVREFVLTAPTSTEDPHDWGYLNRPDGPLGDRLYGTVQKRGASFSRLHLNMVNTIEGDYRPVIVSESVFCIDRFTGEPKWTYRDGAVMNNAIAMDADHIYFIESRNADAMADDDGRMRIDKFCASGTFLVALDAATGEKAWERACRLPFEHIMFLCCPADTVLVTGTYNKETADYGLRPHYGLFAFSKADGAPKWDTAYMALDIRGNEPSPTGGSHGEQWQHPVVIGDEVYLRPYAFSLETGEQLPYKVRRGGHGCGGLTGSAHYLYGRGGNPRMYPAKTEDTDGIQLTKVSRPGCWLNIIPVGGMVLIPESSSGCTCSYPLQTSFGLTPVEASGRRQP